MALEVVFGCSGCKKSLPPSEFSACSARWNGLQAYCRSCARDKYKQYRIKNKQKIKLRMLDWRIKSEEAILRYREKYYSENRQRLIDNACQWARNNPEKLKARREARMRDFPKTQYLVRKRHREKNSESISSYAKAYSRAKPWVFRRKGAKRRAIKAMATVAWGDEVKILDIYQRCAAITESTGVKHEVDHIVPLNSKIVCGLHWEGNLQIISKKENMSKGNRFWPDMP